MTVGTDPVYLTVTIDTEEDNWGEYQRPLYTVENLRRIPVLQQLFADRGVRPTYLISYPVATSAMAVDILGPYRQQGACEIGTHPHPWNTPPLSETRTASNSYISNLPTTLQYEKIRTLHEAITAAFGSPTTYRSGRWGFSDDVARHLIKLGYTVDTSISPASDWTEFEGPDYSKRTLTPFVYRMDSDAGRGSLLEVPATIDFVQNQRSVASTAYWNLRKVPAGRRALAVLARLGLVNNVAISPETNDAAQMIRLTKALLRRGTRIINMFFHSPTLLEGCSPFVRNAADAAAFLSRIDNYLAFATAAGLRPVTMSDVDAASVGATEVKLLDPKTTGCA